MATLTPEQRKEQIWSVIRVSSGNFLEMYDFFVFGYYASAIGRVFFPTGSDFAQLMLAFMTFGAGFLMRPLGGIFLGAYIDHYGRRAGLMLTLALMAVGTLSIALVPGYATLGASGAVTAVLFAAIVYYPRSSIALMLIPVPIPAPLFAVLYLAFTYYSARRARGPVNHDAHLDGALVGLAFVALTDPSAWARAWQLLIR